MVTRGYVSLNSVKILCLSVLAHNIEPAGYFVLRDKALSTQLSKNYLQTHLAESSFRLSLWCTASVYESAWVLSGALSIQALFEINTGT